MQSSREVFLEQQRVLSECQLQYVLLKRRELRIDCMAYSALGQSIPRKI